MRRFAALRKWVLLPSAIGIALHAPWSLAVGRASDPHVTATDAIILVQSQPPGSQPPGAQPPGAQAPGAQPPGAQPPGSQPPGVQPPGSQPQTQAAQAPGAGGGGALTTGFSATGGSTSEGTSTRVSGAGESTGAISIGGGQSQPRAATDVGDLLGKSQEATGVEIQRRSPVISDPRIRGQHVGQVVTFSDGGFFFPARQDLDTAVSKYDSSSIRDVIITKGPFTVLYGPGFSFLDIATYDTPRYQDMPEYHGSTKFGFQSNGQRYDGLQSFWGGGEDWGFRFSYGIRAGNDYFAGGSPFNDGSTYIVPSSYNSQPFQWALGYNLSPDSKIEYKGLRWDLRNAEFAGVYFDISHLGTDAQSIRYTAANQQFFDQLVFDVWYNRTAADGNTLQGAKQVFLSTLLTPIFFPGGGGIILDRSTTSFTEYSQGYRLGFTWGETGCPRLTIGSDLNYVHQELTENIRYVSATGSPVSLFQPPNQTVGTQTLGIPSSRLVDPGIFAEASLPVGKRFTFRTGARGDFVETNSAPRLITGSIPVFFTPPASAQTSFDPIIFSVDPRNQDLQKFFPLWSAFLSAEYKIDKQHTALASFGYAQRPPTLTELYAAGPYIAVLQQGLNRLYGDPNLAPEKMKMLDLGIRANYGWLRGGLTGFYAWVDDYITFDLVGGELDPTTNDNILQVVYTNTDRATLAGAEIFGELDVTDWLTGFASTQYVEGRDLTHIDNRRDPNLLSSRRTIDTEPLPGIPPLDSRVGFRLHESKPNPRWAIEFAVRLVNSQDLVAVSLLEQATPGFTIWDIRSFWQVNSNLLLTAGVENIGNKFYREHLDPRAGFPTDLMFRPGTNAYVGAQLQY